MGQEGTIAWVRNIIDGAVTVEVEGTYITIEALVDETGEEEIEITLDVIEELQEYEHLIIKTLKLNGFHVKEIGYALDDDH